MPHLWTLPRRHAFVLAVVGVSLVLRLCIVARGGDYYWADELRYESSRKVCAALAIGDLGAATTAMFSTSGHIGFRWLALVPAAAERAVYGSRPPHARICSGFFALFGVVNLVLVWWIARRVSGDEWEAGLALALAACSNALFFHARHCFPYDASLTFFLWAVYLSAGPARPRQSFAVGLGCGLGYLIYNGYWSVGAVVLILDVVWRRAAWLSRLRRTALGAIGVAAPIAIVFAAARLAGFDLVADSLAFADTVNQGDFGEGWRFPFEYLAITDGGLALGLALFVVAGLIGSGVQRTFAPWLRWVATLLLLYAIWVSFCDVVPKFVLYGRTVRAAVPFLALAAAGGLNLLRQSMRPAWHSALLVPVAAACAAGGCMLITPLRQVFPSRFLELTRPILADLLQRDPNAVVQVLNADYIRSTNFPEPPPHRELLRRAHPHQYRPYLYEGYTRAQRPIYLGPDIAMRLVQLDTSRGLHLLQRSPVARPLAPYPGPLALFLRLPDGAAGRTESVLVHGEDPDRQERLLIAYPDSSHVRVGCQHGSDAPRLSDPLPCDYGNDHAISVSFGSFYPPSGHPGALDSTALDTLRRRAIVTFDSRTALVAEAAFVAVPLAELRIQGAGPGMRPAEGGFSGTVHAVRQIDPQRMADVESRRGRPGLAVTGPFFGEYFGPLELQVRFPADAPATSEPLMATGKPGEGDMLFVSYVGPRGVRFHLDHWGTPALGSRVFEIQPGASQRIVVSFGSLLPPKNSSHYDGAPRLRKMTDWLFVRLNEEVVFWRPCEFHPAEPDAVSFGESLPGATTAAPRFSGEIVSVRRLSPIEAIPAAPEVGEGRFVR